MFVVFLLAFTLVLNREFFVIGISFNKRCMKVEVSYLGLILICIVL